MNVPISFEEILIIRKIIWPTVLLVAIIAFGSACADVIYMKNGKEFNCEVIHEDEEKITTIIDGLPSFIYKRDIEVIEINGVKRYLNKTASSIPTPTESTESLIPLYLNRLWMIQNHRSVPIGDII